MSKSRALIASLVGLLITVLCAGQTFAGACVDGKASYIGLVRDVGPGSPDFFMGNFKEIVNPAGDVDYFAHTKMGDSGDLALAGQWVLRGQEAGSPPGEGPDTIALYRPSNNIYYLSDINPDAPSFADKTPTAPAPNFTEVPWGIAGDVPVVGNWDGLNEIDKVGIWRPSEQNFYQAASNQPGAALLGIITFGDMTDTPLSGQFDGSAGDEVGVARVENNVLQFYLRQNDGFIVNLALGDANDQPLIGDWDGDGQDNIGIFRSSNQTFYLSNQTAPGLAGVDIQFTAGAATDVGIGAGWWGNCPAP